MPGTVLHNSCCVAAAVAGCWLTCCGSGNQLAARTVGWGRGLQGGCGAVAAMFRTWC